MALPRDPNKFVKMLTDCGVDFLNGRPSTLPCPLLCTGLGCTLGGGGRGGGTFRDVSRDALKGESSQFVVGVYLLGFPLAPGGGAGAGLDGTADDDDDDDDVGLCICTERSVGQEAGGG